MAAEGAEARPMKCIRSVILTPFIIAVISLQSAFSQTNDAVSFDDKYKDHSYVFLRYDVLVELHEDWSITTREHKTVRIQKDDAKSMGEIPLTYDRSREKITGFKAYTVTPDGVRHDYTKVQDMPLFESFAMYSDQMVRIITVPAVSIGSTIEYEATVLSKGEVMKDQFWYMTDLNSNVPMRRMTLTVIFPKKSQVAYKEFNLFQKPVITDDGSKITYKWDLSDVYKEDDGEEFPPPPRAEDFTESVEFSSTKSWKEVSDWYYGLIQKNMTTNDAIRSAAVAAAREERSVKDKARALVEYIQDNFRYVSMSFGANTLEPHPVDEIFANKYGDCKDLSLLYIAMLKEAGVKANMALFNVESDISDPQFDLPMPILFDHAIVEVESPEGRFYVDPMLRGYNIGEYPLFYQGAYMLVITPDGGRFARIGEFDENRSYTLEEKTTAIRADGSASVTLRSLYNLDMSLEFKEMWRAATDSDKRKFFEGFAGEVAQDGEMLENKFDNVDSRYGQVTNIIRYEKPGMYQINDDMIVLDLERFDKGELFTQKERKNPVFYPVNSRSERRSVITIPEGYGVLYMPESFSEEMGFLSFRRDFKRSGRKIAIDETERYRRMELPASDYRKLQDFLVGLSKKSSQRIILKKDKARWRVTEAARKALSKVRSFFKR